ncbi:Hypothetical predicted protein, partial [Paramuricea clavata]
MAEKDEGKKKRTNRGITWPDTAAIALLNIWQEEEIRISLETCKSSKEMRATYRTITLELHKKGFTDYTLENVVNKMKKLRQRFKKEVDSAKKSGKGRAKPWKFFQRLNDIIGHRPNVRPAFCVDTSAGEKAEDNSDIDHGEEQET